MTATIYNNKLTITSYGEIHENGYGVTPDGNGDVTAEYLNLAEIYHDSITTITLSKRCTKIGQRVLEEFAKTISCYPFLTSVSLYATYLDGNEVSQILEKVLYPEKIVSLDLQNTSLGYDGIKKLAPILSKFISLEFLCLSHRSPIHDSGVKEVVNIVAKMPLLKRLNLCGLSITDAGVNLIANCIILNNLSLETLWLYVNEITNKGLADITNILENHPNLKEIGLESNPIRSFYYLRSPWRLNPHGVIVKKTFPSLSSSTSTAHIPEQKKFEIFDRISSPIEVPFLSLSTSTADIPEPEKGRPQEIISEASCSTSPMPSTWTTPECTICLDQPRNITFVPCGHLVTCESCAVKVHQCVVCRGKIDFKVKTILS